MIDLRSIENKEGIQGDFHICVERNPLHWPGTNAPISVESLQESDPRKLRDLLLRKDSTNISAAGLAFAGRTMHGKTHASRWVVADETDFDSLRICIPHGNRTWGFDRYSKTLSPKQHGQPKLAELWLTVVDVGGHREQLNSVCNLVYMNARRSVFVLVLKASESFKYGNWGHYYLKLIESLRVQKRNIEDGRPYELEDLAKNDGGADRIPVVLLVSHGDGERNLDLPELSELRTTYPLLDVLIFDPWEAPQGDKYLPALHRAIGEQVAKISALQERVVLSTLSIRDQLVRTFELDRGFSDRIRPRLNSMSVLEFRELCQSQGEISEAVQDAAIRELAALGFLIVVGGTKRIKPGTRILNPRFVNHFVFSGVLERGGLELEDGFMSDDWFDDLMRDIKDPLEIADLKQLMRDCLVTFEWKHGNFSAGQFVPDLLPMRPAGEHPVWSDSQCKLTLRPKGFLNESAFFAFVSERRSDLKPVQVVKRVSGREKITLLFRNECVMHNEACDALVKVNVIEQEIVIEVRGPNYAKARSYGDGLRLVLRSKIDSDLEGEWELSGFERIAKLLSQKEKTWTRARKILRHITSELTDAQKRHSWSGHQLGEWLDESPGPTTSKTEFSQENWDLAKRAIEKLVELEIIEGGPQNGFRLTEHVGHPIMGWVAGKRCLE